MAYTESDPTIVQTSETETPLSKELTVEEAFSEYYPALFRTALRFMKNHADAEELVAEVFAKAVQEKQKPDSNPLLRAWYFRVLVNLGINKYRRDKRRKDQLAEPDAFVFTGVVDPSAEAILDELIEGQAIEHAKSLITTEQMRMLAMYGIEGYSYAEIADIEGIAVGTVMSRLHRGRTTLRTNHDFRKAVGRQIL